MSTDFRAITERESRALLDKIEATTRAIEGDVDNFQGKRNEIPLFKVDPAFGERAEAVLERLKKRRDEIDGLAAPAREQAQKMYGSDILPPRHKQ